MVKKTTKKEAKDTKKAPVPKAPKVIPVPSVDWGHNQDIITKDEKINALKNSLNSAERKLIVSADEAPNTYYLRRPTGIIDLDIDIGGGFPAGGCCMLSGPENSGKTWLALKTMAYQQKLYDHNCRVAYATTEGAFPFDQAINAGVKVKIPDEMITQWQQYRTLRGLPCWTDEEVQRLFKQSVGRIEVIRGYTGEELLQALLESVRSNAFSLIILDSIAGLLPSVDATKVMDERDMMSAQAAMLTKFFRKYAPCTTGIIEPNITTLIFTQQVRANMERSSAPAMQQKYIKLWSVTGSWAAKHFKLIDLHVWNGKLLRKKEGEASEVVGKMFKWFVEKGKAGTHDNIGGEAAFYYALGGTDDVGELIASGVRRGVIQMLSKKVVVVQPDTGKMLAEFTAPSQRAMRKMIEADFEFDIALRREILTAAEKECLYR